MTIVKLVPIAKQVTVAMAPATQNCVPRVIGVKALLTSKVAQQVDLETRKGTSMKIKRAKIAVPVGTNQYLAKRLVIPVAL